MTTLTLPAATIPHVDQYFGVWAIDHEKGDALLSLAERVDLNCHLQQQAAFGGPNSAPSYDLTRDGVAVIELRGPMMKHSSSLFSGTATALARRNLLAAGRDPAVRGVLLVIDSPGGTVAGTELLAAAVGEVRSKKPVWAGIDDLCASAAYWVGSQCERITANRSAAVGSIGVYTVVYDTSASDEKSGRKVHVVKYGANKAIGAGGPVTEEQLAEIQRLINARGEQFIDAVAVGRNVDRSKAAGWADGRVELAPEALTIGLIDAIQTHDETLAELTAHLQTQSQTRRVTMADSTPSLKDQLAAKRAEIKAAVPKADDAFVNECVANDKSPLEALQKWSDRESARADEAEQARVEADKRAAEAAKLNAATTKRGSDPLDTVPTDKQDQGGSFDRMAVAAEINALVARGTPRAVAAIRVLKQHGCSRPYKKPQ